MSFNYAFGAIEGHLASLASLNTLLESKSAELHGELNTWASYWQGTAQTRAFEFSSQVNKTLMHATEVSKAYVAKAHAAVNDMATQEAANAAQW